MKFNKVFSILSLVMLVSITGSSFSMKFFRKLFSMRREQINPREFHKIDAVELHHEACRAMSPCGNYVVSRLFGKIKVWDIRTNREVCSYDHFYSFHVYSHGYPTDACFSPCRNYVATRSLREVKVWDIRRNRKVCSYNHRDYVFCVCFSPCGNYIASGSHEEVKVWNINKNQQVCYYKHNGYCNRDVGCVCLSLCGNYVASGSNNLFGSRLGEVKVWDIRTNQEVCFYNHNGKVECVCFSPCGNYVASGSSNFSGSELGEVKVWDIRTNQEVCSYHHYLWL